MVRSVGITAVVLGLAWTGLAGAQSSAPLQKARYINVSEEGKPTQRCKLLQSWRERNGAPVFQVQAVESGEMMTIVGAGPQGAGGDPRAMSTRIFRWGRDNKPPTGAPLPPSTPTVVAAPPASPAPAPAQPAVKPYVLTSNQPLLTPMGTPVIQHPSGPIPGSQLPAAGSTTASPPRLTPLAAGTGCCPNPCNCPNPCKCACPPPCCNCCKPCNPCGQSSCVRCTPSPMRQPFLSRLVKSNNPCSCTTVTCTPMQPPAMKPAATMPPVATVAKTPTTAKPDDWRESWGKTEPWKAPAQANSSKLTAQVVKRVDPTPVPMEPSNQPDPLKAPGQFRDIVMNARLSNNRLPQQDKPSASSRLKQLLAPTRTMGPRMAESGKQIVVEQPNMLPPPQSPGRMVQIAADEPNAFWSPQPPPGMGQEKSKFNAAHLSAPPPPQGMPPTIAGVPPTLPGVPPAFAAVSLGLAPPRGPMLMNPPRPPQAPFTAPPGPPQPMAPSTGVADAMGNAFTLPGTRRPIPADFGGTPQEPNGFDPPMQMGQGSPPIAYGMGTPGTARQPMLNRVAMGQHAPMGVNPLMSVPPPAFARRGAGSISGKAVANASVSPPNVSQTLATLKESLFPSERETAAEQLSELNWRSQPQVVESLIKAAREDPAATVRAACVHALAQMKVNTSAAVEVVRDLKSDRDPGVRHEAEESFGALSDSGIQQTSHK